MRLEDEEKRQVWAAFRAHEQQEDNLASLMDRLEELETKLNQLVTDYEETRLQTARFYHPKDNRSESSEKGKNIFPLREVHKPGIFTR